MRAGATVLSTDALTLPASRSEEREFDETARAMLAFVGLEAHAAQPAANLPFGARKRVELARALAARPHPACCSTSRRAASITRKSPTLGALIRAIRDRLGITVLLVEHHMGLVMGLSDQVVALNFGRVIADGTPEQVRGDPDVDRAYLGTAALMAPILELRAA